MQAFSENISVVIIFLELGGIIFKILCKTTMKYIYISECLEISTEAPVYFALLYDKGTINFGITI